MHTPCHGAFCHTEAECLTLTCARMETEDERRREKTRDEERGRVKIRDLFPSSLFSLLSSLLVLLSSVFFLALLSSRVEQKRSDEERRGLTHGSSLVIARRL